MSIKPMPSSRSLPSVGRKTKILNNSYMSSIVFITSLYVVSIFFLNAAKKIFNLMLNVICIKLVLPQEANLTYLENITKMMSKLSKLKWEEAKSKVMAEETRSWIIAGETKSQVMAEEIKS